MLRENRSRGDEVAVTVHVNMTHLEPTFFFLLETGARPHTSLSTKPLNLNPNNPTTPFVKHGGLQVCAHAGSYIFKTPLIDGSLACGPRDQGH